MSTKVTMERMLTVHTPAGFTRVRPQARLLLRTGWWGLFCAAILNAGFSFGAGEWQIGVFSVCVAAFLIGAGWLGFNAARMEYERDVVLAVLRDLGVHVEQRAPGPRPEDPRNWG